MQIAEFSGLLQPLYAAPLNPLEWQNFLAQLCAVTGSASGYLISNSPCTGATCLAGAGSGFDPDAMRLLNEHYAEQDPYRAAWLMAPRDGVLEGESLVCRETLLRSEFWHALLARDNFTSLAMIVDSRQENEVHVLSLWRDAHQGPLERSAQKLLEMLVPHVRAALDLRAHTRALTLGRRVRETNAEAGPLAPPGDSAGGVLLVMENGRIMFLDREASRFLERADGVYIDKGRLAAECECEADRLNMLLLASSRRGRGSREACPCGGAMRIRRRAGGSFYLLLMPPTDASERTGIPHDALVYLQETARPPASRSRVLQQLYALTPTESRLADLLLGGKVISEVADEMRITRETARYHLKHVFSKMGVRRQAELMHLGLSLPAIG